MRYSLTLAALCLSGLGTGAIAQDAFLSVADSADYGQYLVGPDGRPVYAFVTDKRAGDGLPPLESCNVSCRDRWPPVFSSEEIEVGEGLDDELVATIADEDGEVAVYNSEPLFYFIDDEMGGTPMGQGIQSFGGWWYLVRPNGELIESGILPEVGN